MRKMKNLEKLYERASSTRPKLVKRAPNIGGFAANIACGFLEFWTCGTRSLIKFLEVFVFFPLTIARNNTLMHSFQEPAKRVLNETGAFE